MPHGRRILLGSLIALVAAGAVVAVVALAGSEDSGDRERAAAAEPNIVQAGAPGEASRKLSQDEAAKVETPRHTEADVEFARGMIHHHAQALEMTDDVPERAVGRRIRVLAKRMEVSQEAEIELLANWLEARGEAPPEPSEHAAGHGGQLMPGMLTEAQLARLEAARGRAFNRRFLRSMLRHHHGALTMVADLRRANGGLEPELDAVIRHIESDQSIEIDRTQALLGAR